MARGRYAHAPVDPLPWPVLREDLNVPAGYGLRETWFADSLIERDGVPMRDFRAGYECMR